MKKIEKTEKRISYSSLTQNLWLVCISMLFLSGYTSQLRAQCNGEIVINQTGPGVFTWDAPATGGPFEVEIIATGGGGGDNNLFFFGGGGASMSGIFTVQNGQRLFAIAGGAGGSSGGSEGGGGGAGSGVVRCNTPSECATGTVLIIAAGGNGAESTDGLGGSISTGGNGGGGAGGGGNGGGGGGGRFSGGSSGTGMGMGFGGAVVFTNGLSAGGDGSSSDNNGAIGMGGGGGGGSSANNGSGGGGGHTGASGGNTISAQSFNTGTSQVNAPGDPGSGNAAGSVIVICVQSLPVKLINFKAVIEDSNVSLLWSTATEKNNLGFEVERSTDNRHWTTLGFVPGNGTTALRNDYNFTDEKPLAGVNYYRLRQNDSDGQFEYSPIVIADVRGSGLQFDVFPNPSITGELSIRAVSEQEGNGMLEIFDWVGYKVFMETVQLHKGTTIFPVAMTTFPKGTYTARLKMPDGQMQFKKIVLQ